MINFRSEKGGVTIYVLVAMLLITITLVAMYMSTTNRQMTQLDIAEQIKTVYEKDVNNIDEVYNNMATLD